MRSRKETAGRGSRRFGDVFGGRTRPKLADGIFRRLHPFTAPSQATQTPILIEDNPSRDFFFPLDGREALDALRRLPPGHVAWITHLWLRRVLKTDFASGGHSLAEFVCGRGVRLIVLYPWPRDMLLPLGRSKPLPAVLRSYSRWTGELIERKGEWFLRWAMPELRSFYVQGLLFHEVGHHVDQYRRRWSKANRRRVEEFAEQYAVEWGAAAKRVTAG